MAQFGQIASPFPNALYDPAKIDAAVDARNINALNIQGAQQQQAGAEMEYLARASQGVLALPEAERPAAYQAAVKELQGYGFARNAPGVYDEGTVRRVAMMGVPSKDLYTTGANREANRALLSGLGVGGAGTPAAPGAPPAAPGTAPTTAEGGPDYSVPRGIRNNNPLNLSFAKQPGAVLENHPDPRFAKFDTPEAGVAAAVNQLKLYQSRGNNTLRGMISTWAPPSENDTEGYVRFVVKQTGLDPDKPVDLNDAAVASKLVQAMARQETGRPLDPAVADRGVAGPGRVQVASVTPTTMTDASPAPPGAPPVAPAAAPVPVGNLGLVRNPDGTVGTPNGGGLGGAAEPAPAAPVPAAVAPNALAPPAPPAPAPTPAQPPASDIPPPGRYTPQQVQELQRLGNAPGTTTAQLTTAMRQFDDDNRQERAARATTAQTQLTNQRAAEADARAARTEQRLQDEAIRKAKGEDSPFPGTSEDAAAKRTMRILRPKMLDGSATEEERADYSLAASHFTKAGPPMLMPDPNDPTRQILASVPGQIPEGFPPPNFRPGGDAGGGTGQGPKPIPGTSRPIAMTEGQGQAAAFADRMHIATPIMNELDDATTYGQKGLEKAGKYIGYNLNTPEYQRLRTAQEAFLSGVLRKESGAAVNPDEWERYAHLYFPMPGEDVKTAELKRQIREATMGGMVREAGPGYKPTVTAKPQDSKPKDPDEGKTITGPGGKRMILRSGKWEPL